MPPPPPSEQEVKEQVTGFVAAFSNIKPSQVREEWALKGTQLSLDDNGLAFLAMSLRGYVRQFKPSETVLASDVRKKDLTVKGLTEFIYNKITQ